MGGYVHYVSGYIHEGCSANDHNRSHDMSHVAWACHFYLVALGELPVVIHKIFKSLIILYFSLV